MLQDRIRGPQQKSEAKRAGGASGGGDRAELLFGDSPTVSAPSQEDVKVAEQGESDLHAETIRSFISNTDPAVAGS
eukprot:5156879-Prorocentrum_lima.AAC.1